MTKQTIKYEETRYGFDYGAARVERLISDEKRGWVVIGVSAGKSRMEVYVTKTGKMRVSINGLEVIA